MTEGLAACLEAAPDAARALVQWVFDVSPPGDVSVETQQTTAYGRPDLEISFRQGRSVVHVVFEVKVDSPAYAEQGIRYMHWLRGSGDDWRFAWLLCVGMDVVPCVPDPARFCTWQDVATALNDWLGSQDDALHGPALVKQYVRHLEDEQLASTQGITEDYALSVNNYEGAKEAVGAVLSQARTRILQRWEVPEAATPQEGFWRDVPWFWQNLQTRSASGPAWPDPHAFQWRCSPDAQREPDRRRGEYAVAAGVVFHRGRQPIRDRDDEWLERRYEQDFEYDFDGEWPALLRWLPLRTIAETPGFAQQVDLVVGGVQKTFEMLLADPPPASALLPAPPEDDAKRSLVRVCELAAEAMGDLWGEGTPGRDPERGDPSSYWWDYGTTTPDGAKLDLPEHWTVNWQVVFDSTYVLLDGRPGVPLLTAGLGAEPGSLAGFATETLDDLTEAGFDVLRAGERSNDWDYIVHKAYIDEPELTLKGDFGSDSVAAWVSHAFRGIAAVLAPKP